MKRNVVVTGGASGMGNAVARKFLECGDRVVLLDANAQRLEQITPELKKLYGDDVWIEALDISSEEAIGQLATRVVEKLGPCDVLVNCAGVFRGGLLHMADTADYTIQFDVNVRGMFFMMRAFLPSMIGQGSGAIVNISSVSGIRGDYNAPLYCASKAAVIGLTQSTALDYGEKGIRINCVSPSATETPMFLDGTSDAVMSAFLEALPDHRLGKPEQIADAVLFLASEGAKHINGHNIPVDGGLTAWNGQPKQNKEEG